MFRTCWSGCCLRCAIDWPPAPGTNRCPRCGAGPLARFRDGSYLIHLVEYAGWRAPIAAVIGALMRRVRVRRRRRS